MEAFQKIVIIIAVVLLILALVFIGISLKNTKKDSWPPLVGDCPDYWLAVGSNDMSGVDVSNLGKGPFCVNVKDLGKCPPRPGHKHLIMNFNKPPFTGDNGNCAKYNWANTCNITWDGLTYGAENPCDTSSSSKLT